MLILLQIIIAAIGITAGSYFDNNVTHAQVVQALQETSATGGQVYQTQMLAPQRTDGSLILCSSGILFCDASSSDPKLIPWNNVAKWELTPQWKADGEGADPVELRVTAMTKVAFKDDHYDFAIEGTPSDGAALAQSLKHYDPAAGAD